MNPIRKVIHRMMGLSGLDTYVNAGKVNRWLEKKQNLLHKVLSTETGNTMLREALTSGNPFAAGKIGDIELMALCWHLQIRIFYKYTFQSPTFGDLKLDSDAGVFPRDPAVFHRFCERYLAELGAINLIGVWFNSGENRVISKYCQNPKRCDLRSIEPWFASEKPWTHALEGKKVLVIHPFEHTIQNQFKNRHKVWADKRNILPDFELLTLKAPYGFSKNDFACWMEMLHWLESQMERIDQRSGFDVALIACGAASLPLASKAKKMGKVGIHMGGPLQLLFGIRGRRWETRPEFQILFNESWCSPDVSERPPEYSRVDKGGYW